MVTNTAGFLQNGSKTGELIRNTDWSETAFGQPDLWPESLKSSLSICLNSSFPIAIFWGENFTLFYNDAYGEILGNKHPGMLGKPSAVAWAEIWLVLEPKFKSIMFGHGAIRSNDELLPMQRFGYIEECYFDYSLSPITDANGDIQGIFNAVIETSYRVINERRNRVLHSLLKLNTTQSFKESIETGIQILEDAKADLPFCLIYTTSADQPDEFKLAASVGAPVEDVYDIIWPYDASFTDKKPVVLVDNLSAYIKNEIKPVWSEPCTEVLIVPLDIPETNIKSFMVAGISPRNKLDIDYQQFIESAANYIGMAMNKGYLFMQEQQSKIRILESENRFRKMIEQAPVAMMVLRGKEMLISKANQMMLDILGRSEGVMAKALLEVLPEVENHPAVATLKAVYETGKTEFGYDMPVPIQRNNLPEDCYFDFTFSPLTEENRITGVLVVATEVTERYKARHKLLESEALFRGITSASPTALWITDHLANITYVNDTWLRWTGKSLDFHLKYGWLDSVVAADLESVRNKFAADFAKRQYHENSFRIIDKDEKERWIVCTGNPQFDDEQHFTGYIGACVDITEQKQLQHQKDNFLGIASHELKTPVTSIKAYAQVLEVMFRRDGDTKKADMLVKLDKQINRLSNLIADLLDVTKIHTGKMQFNQTTFNFSTLVEEVIEEVQRTSFKHTILKELNFNGYIFGDAERISQVITNLLTNAIKYSPDAKHIIVSTKQENENMVLCIEDFGIGISPDKKDNVFEQFYRVSGTKEHTFPGLGLGLYISSEIVKRLNGKIWVNSVEGKGSVFCFSLPVIH